MILVDVRRQGRSQRQCVNSLHVAFQEKGNDSEQAHIHVQEIRERARDGSEDIDQTENSDDGSCTTREETEHRDTCWAALDVGV